MATIAEMIYEYESNMLKMKARRQALLLILTEEDNYAERDNLRHRILDLDWVITDSARDLAAMKKYAEEGNTWQRQKEKR